MVTLALYITHCTEGKGEKMLLTKTGLDASVSKISISFEEIADDFLMVSLINNNNCRIPSYWRLVKKVGMPPLEIGINCDNGHISNITFFVDSLTKSDINDDSVSIIDGNVIVDTSIFTKTNEYIDVFREYNVYYTNNKLVCLFSNQDNISGIFRDNRFEIYVDNNEQIMGFSICDLSENEKKLVDNLPIINQ